jgi:hypothetical protein
MAISTRWPASPVTRPAYSPSIVARPSSSRPSSWKKSIVPPRSSTTIPTLSIRLSAMRRLYRMSPRCNNGRFATPKQNRRGVCQIAPERPLIGADHGQSGSDRRITAEKALVAGNHRFARNRRDRQDLKMPRGNPFGIPTSPTPRSSFQNQDFEWNSQGRKGLVTEASGPQRSACTECGVYCGVDSTHGNYPDSS